MRDFQKQRVYDWERLAVQPKDKSLVPYSNLQTITNYIWEREALVYPPMVTAMPKQNRNAWAKANRTHVYAPEAGLPTWVLIHELAHSLTCTVEGHSERHGPEFVGMYMRLLEKHLGIPMPLLMYTANANGVQFNINARVAFLD